MVLFTTVGSKGLLKLPKISVESCLGVTKLSSGGGGGGGGASGIYPQFSFSTSACSDTVEH